MLGGASISVVDDYDAGLAAAGTIYFVKSSEDNTLSAMHFTPKAVIEEEETEEEPEDVG